MLRQALLCGFGLVLFFMVIYCHEEEAESFSSLHEAPALPVPTAASVVPSQPQRFNNIGVKDQASCFKKIGNVPLSAQRLKGSYYDTYIEFGRRWTELPFCPPKNTTWTRGSERYVGGGGLQAGIENTPVVVMCSTIAANEEFFVKEWAVYHLLLGVARINIYPINKEQRTRLEAALRPISPDRVWVEPTESVMSEEWMAAGGNHVSFEKRSIARCFRERLNNSDIVLHTDLDEYLFPGLYKTIPEMLSAELRHKDELTLCVRYMGYGATPPTSFANGTLYLRETRFSGSFCSNSKAAGLARCVKKPAVKVRSHFVHTLPMCCGCRSDALAGTYMKKVAPSPCCRPSYFVAHMQQRDFTLDSHRRRREVSPTAPQARQVYLDWHTMTTIPDTRMHPYGDAVRAAVQARCFSSLGTPCKVPVPDPVQPL